MCYQGSALQETKHLNFAKFMKRHELTLHISYSEKPLLISAKNSNDLFEYIFLNFQKKNSRGQSKLKYK